MNKLLENYNKSVKALEEYFDCDYFGNYIIQENPNDYWTSDGSEIQWGENKADLDYSAEFRELIFTDELVAVLVDSDFGGEPYWNIFYNEKVVEHED